jgi:hypothetical protein
MSSSIHEKHSNSLLLLLLNSLADFDGQISEDAALILQELACRYDRIPPLYADVFGLPATATCTDLVQRIYTFSEHQIAVASYAFQIFRSYEQMLRANKTDVAPEQRAAYESQLDRIRTVVARTRATLLEAIGENGRG